LAALAARLFAAEGAWRTRHHLSEHPSLWALYAVPGQKEDVSAIRASLDERQFAEAWAGGEQLELNAALDEALNTV
jgi:hypothetical protein